MKHLSILCAVCFVSCAMAVETLENKFMKLTVAEHGGKIVSLIDKATGQELVQGGDTQDGCGKIVDALFQNVELLTTKYELKKEADTITATAQFFTANLNGVTLERTFRLEQNVSAVEITHRLQSNTQENRIAPKLHNMVRFGDNARFFVPSASGMVQVTKEECAMQKLQLVMDTQEPWIAGLDGAQGVALFVLDGGKLDYAFTWQGTTLEAGFQQLALRPIAEADVWKCSHLLVLFQGEGNVTQITPEAVITQTDKQSRAFFVRDLGKRRITFGKATLGEVNCQAGKTFPFASGAGELKLESGDGEISIALPQWKKREALHKMPPRQENGTNGYYYYYPDIYLSKEIDTDASLSLRGDFSKRKNLRVGLLLPKGVELTWTRYAKLGEREVTVKDVPLRCHEIEVKRVKTYSTNAVSINLRATEEFQEGSVGYIQTIWDGGELPPQPITFKLTPPLPDVHGGMKHFRIALMEDSDRPNAEWAKVGVNTVKFTDWEVNYYHSQREPDDFYVERRKRWLDAGIRSATQFSSCFSRARNLMEGKYVEGAHTFFHPTKHYVDFELDDFRAIDNLGQKTMQICPWYRGPYFEKMIDNLKTTKDYGFDYVIFDEENWANGITLCHCPRCLKKFGKDPAKFPKEWLEFKTDAVADIYRRFKEELDPNTTLAVWVDHRVEESAMTNRLTDSAKLAKYVDEIYPMVYNASADFVRDRAQAFTSILKGTKAKLVMGLSPNRVYEYYRVASQNYAPLEAETQQMLEAAFNGAKGVIFWWHRGAFRGAMGFYNIARAVQLLQPIEDILLQGAPCEVPCSNPEVRVTAYEWNGRIAVFARNYDRGVVRATVAGRPLEFKDTRVAVFELQK